MNCRACGNSVVWCSVYTSCPLNKGKAHSFREDYPGQAYFHMYNPDLRRAEERLKNLEIK